MLQIRRAHVDEAGALSDLCFRSKAYWGYSDAFMEACREDLTVTPDYIETGLVIVLEDENRLLGFMGLEQLEESGRWLLKDLFVEPDAIGKGYGKTLWEHMRKLAKELRIGSLLIHSPACGSVLFGEGSKAHRGERQQRQSHPVTDNGWLFCVPKRLAPHGTSQPFFSPPTTLQKRKRTVR